MNKYFKTLLAAAVVVSFTSCLKDKEFDDHVYGHTGIESGKIIELGVYNSLAHEGGAAADFVDASIQLSVVNVRLASKEPATEDITVTLDTAGTAAFIEDYNDANDKSVVKLPNSFFTLPATGFKVTIPKGEREVSFKITTNAINFDPSTTYGLYFKLASVDKSGYTLSTNFGSYFTTIGAKNDYDGEYTLEFKNYHPSSNPGYTGTTVPVYMVTTSGTSCKLFFPAANAYAPPSVLGGALSYFSSQEPEYTFDAVTNKVTVQNAYSGAVTFYQMALDFDSHYDPTNKIIYAKYGYNYNSNGTFNPAANREWTQKFTYVGPRP
ncbi:DUF1735 domain-containing protein [Ferruginibacter sp. HRS2-29]|uniref:DUF1735 domain-containing protein n=1 Tax=Ferruginibacter sp. HRS2-29 TaxID=2487334 RepID=UPI0020CE6927|nr:DUF1735 domain-containing protein [Ferruginibacter sp. HRS2-29]MCP9753309.1 DUF1735 domain-containing protein [Ferruginibacter sp. HRS2-29]